MTLKEQDSGKKMMMIDVALKLLKIVVELGVRNQKLHKRETRKKKEEIVIIEHMIAFR